MQRRWTGQNVDLNLLCDGIGDFFKSRKFVVGRSGSTGETKIVLRPTYPTVKLEEPISVRIVGDPNDFTVDLKASELTTRPVRMGLLTKSLGGGYFLLRSLKLQEELEKMEKEFWIFVEDRVAELARSA